MVQRVSQIDDLISQFSRSQAGILCFCDAARDVDEHAFAVLPQASLERGFQIPALGADAGGQEPQIRRGGADAFQRFGLGGADDEADVVCGVPLLGEIGNVLIQVTDRGPWTVDGSSVNGLWSRSGLENHHCPGLLVLHSKNTPFSG